MDINLHGIEFAVVYAAAVFLLSLVFPKAFGDGHPDSK